MLQWGDQKDFVLFHRVKKLRDVWVGLGVGVCEDTELECQMRLVEEIIEQRETRNCRHNDRYVRTMTNNRTIRTIWSSFLFFLSFLLYFFPLMPAPSRTPGSLF